MQKFPLRMKDNDLLVTELYKDNTVNDHITAISVYLTPKITSEYRTGAESPLLMDLCPPFCIHC